MTSFRMLNVNEVNDITVVRFRRQRLRGEEDNQELGRELFQLVERDGVRKLLLNFDGVTIISSGALGKIITLHKKMEGLGGCLILCNINPSLHRVLVTTHLDRVFEIKVDEATARLAF